MQQDISVLENTILKYSTVSENRFDGELEIVGNFIDYAAKKYNVTLKKDKEKKLNSLIYKNTEIGYMQGLRTSSTKDIAYRLCRNKFLLEEHLRLMNLNTLSSKHFSETEKDKALRYTAENKKQKFVVKPLNLAGGKGVILDVSWDQVSSAWDQCIAIQDEEGVKVKSCIIQPYIKGFDVRVSIIEGRYAGAILRLPAHVVGDGQSSIIKLIEVKNNARKRIPYFKTKLIPTDSILENQLKKQGINESYVPNKNEIIVINEISNLTMGGESIEISQLLSQKIIDLAINAAASVPGLYSSGIDIMTTDYLKGEGYIIEMNTSPNLTMHHLPLKGKKRFPYYTFVRCCLINYKVENAIRLTVKEAEIFSEINNFNKLKDYYSGTIMKELLSSSY